MKLPQVVKKFVKWIIVGQILLSFNLLAEEQKAVAAFFKAGAGMTQADAENIAGQGIESICSKFSGYKCFDRTQSMNAILKEQALGKDGLTNVDYEKIGKGVKGAEFVMPVTISKYPDGGYSMRAEIINAADGMPVPGMSVTYSSKAKTQIDFAEDLKKMGAGVEKQLAPAKSYVSISKTCTTITNDYFSEYFTGCLQSDSSTVDKFVECYATKALTYCNDRNKNNPKCETSCQDSAVSLFKTFFIEWERQDTECKNKGPNYTFDGKCHYNPPVTPAKPVTPDSSSSVSSSSKPDHDGSASWIIPGLGLVLKNRPIWGILFFGATVGAYSDYSSKLQAYKDSREEYRAFVPVPLPLNFGTTGNYLYYEMRYQAFKNSAEEATSAANMLGAIYITQVIMAYSIKADYNFFSFLESENKNKLAYNFNIKRDSSFGVPNSSGTYYTFSLTWGF
jgi:hypothetical protein